MAWNENTLMGVKRFIDRLCKYVEHVNVSDASSDNVLLLLHKTIKGVSFDMENFKYNTAIAKMMELLNGISSQESRISKADLKSIVCLLAPLAPYTAEELWAGLGEKSSVHSSPWPKWEEKYLVEETVSVAVAINGKVRGQITVASDTTAKDKEVFMLAKENEKVKGWLEGKKIVKEIYIPSKMVNFVVV